MAFTRRTTHVAPATAETIAAAAACLRAGGLVAMPTETVYGLAADATSGAAVAGIYAAKGRPTFNPLIAHVLDIAAARREGEFSREADRLAEAFWPGPLTLVLPAAPSCRVSLLARAGLDTLALRAPAHETARALIEAAGTPLAAPSANRSGRVSPTTAAHVLADLDGRIDWILDGGPARLGLESTIVACLDAAPALLRPGAIAREDIEAVLQAPLAVAADAGKTRRLRPGSSNRTMRRAPGFGSRPGMRRATRLRSISPARWQAPPRLRVSISRPRETSSRPPRTSLPICALSTKPGRSASPSPPFPIAASAPRSTTGSNARPRPERPEGRDGRQKLILMSGIAELPRIAGKVTIDGHQPARKA